MKLSKVVDESERLLYGFSENRHKPLLMHSADSVDRLTDP